MAKQVRLVIRMSKDLHDWLRQEADAREQDVSAFARMMLSEQRHGAKAPMASQPEFRAEQPQQDHIEQPSEPIDINEMVAAQLETAPIHEEPRPEPKNGVRSLRRPPTPFSPGAQPSWVK